MKQQIPLLAERQISHRKLPRVACWATINEWLCEELCINLDLYLLTSGFNSRNKTSAEGKEIYQMVLQFVFLHRSIDFLQSHINIGRTEIRIHFLRSFRLHELFISGEGIFLSRDRS